MKTHTNLIRAGIILLFISFLLIEKANAQDRQKLDSLEKVFKMAQDDTNKVIAYNKLSLEWIGIDDNKFLLYNEEALKLSLKIDYKKGVARALNNIGTVLYSQGKYNKALDFFQKSLKIKKGLKNKSDIVTTLNNIGLVYKAQGNYSKALEYHFRSLKIKEELGNKQGITASLTNIGDIYSEMNNNFKALEYHLKSLKISKDINYKEGIARSLCNIGICYERNGDKEKTLDYFISSLKIFEELRNKKGMSGCYNNIGIVYNAQGNYFKALEYYLRSLKNFEELENINEMSHVYNNITSLNINLKNYNKAIEYALKGLKIAKEIGVLETQKYIYKNIATAYDSLHNYKKAYEYHMLFKQINDSIFNEQSSKQIADMQTKYETALKDKTISELNKEKEITNLKLNQSRNFIYGLIILGAFVIIIFFMIFKISRQRQKNRFQAILNEKQRNIAMEILEAQENERNRIGKDLHDGLGSLIAVSKINFSKYQKILPDDYKDIYKNSLNDFDNISNEVRKIAQDLVSNFVMEIGVIRAINEFVEKINNHYNNINVIFNTYGNFDSLTENIQITIYRISQELIYNCVKHSNAGEVVLEIFYKNSQLLLTIEDNGKGFDPQKIDIKGKGMGLHNIKNRLDLLKGKMQVDSQPNEGSVITLEIPVEMKAA